MRMRDREYNKVSVRVCTLYNTEGEREHKATKEEMG